MSPLAPAEELSRGLRVIGKSVGVLRRLDSPGTKDAKHPADPLDAGQLALRVESHAILDGCAVPADRLEAKNERARVGLHVDEDRLHRSDRAGSRQGAGR